MKRILRWAAGLFAGGLAGWLLAGYVSDRRYARPIYEVEQVDAKTYMVDIPKRWRRTNYADPRESPKEFATSTSAIDRNDPYFVFGALDIEDYDSQGIESVIAEWRKGQPNGPVTQTRLGSTEASSWTSQLPMIELVGEARTYVFRGSNGHVYSAHYQLAPKGAYRMRQDYVFGRVLASMRFK